MAKNSNNINELKKLISERRLARLMEKTGSAREAIALHQETLRLGGILIVIIGTVEIALRNSVYMNLKGYFGVADWLQQTPISFRWHELIRLLAGFGYFLAMGGKTSGSRVRFLHADFPVLTVHKPHPSSIIPLYAIRRY